MSKNNTSEGGWQEWRGSNNLAPSMGRTVFASPDDPRNAQETRGSVPPVPCVPCVHYVGFRDDAYLRARRIWGGPAIIHRWWDLRARREIAPGDTVIFAEGEWTQEPRRFNAPDITEKEPA